METFESKLYKVNPDILKALDKYVNTYNIQTSDPEFVKKSYLAGIEKNLPDRTDVNEWLNRTTYRLLSMLTFEYFFRVASKELPGIKILSYSNWQFWRALEYKVEINLLYNRLVIGLELFREYHNMSSIEDMIQKNKIIVDCLYNGISEFYTQTTLSELVTNPKKIFNEIKPTLLKHKK